MSSKETSKNEHSNSLDCPSMSVRHLCSVDEDVEVSQAPPSQEFQGCHHLGANYNKKKWSKIRERLKRSRSIRRDPWQAVCRVESGSTTASPNSSSTQSVPSPPHPSDSPQPQVSNRETTGGTQDASGRNDNSTTSPGAFAVAGPNPEPRMDGYDSSFSQDTISECDDRESVIVAQEVETQDEFAARLRQDVQSDLQTQVQTSIRRQIQSELEHALGQVVTPEEVLSGHIIESEESFVNEPTTDSKGKKRRVSLSVVICLLVFALTSAGIGMIMAFLFRGDDLPPPTDTPDNVSTDFPTSAPTPLPLIPWYQVGQDIEGTFQYERAGTCVSLSNDGKIMAVGSPENTIGYVSMYQYDGGSRTWQQLGQTLSSKQQSDKVKFGFFVSLNGAGTTVAIGAPQGQGYVEVYQHNQTSSKWVRKGQKLKGESFNSFGYSVSLSSDVLAVGAPWDNEGGKNAGKAQIFQYKATKMKWRQLGRDLFGSNETDYFGRSIVLNSNGTIAAIGATQSNSGNTGYVCVYQLNMATSDWIPMGQRLFGKSGDARYGYSVSLSSSGDVLSVGTSDGENSGGVYVYSYNSTSMSWKQLGQRIDGEQAVDYFGRSVSLSSTGGILAIGAPGYDNIAGGINSGFVKIYEYDYEASQWIQMTKTIEGEAADDFGGRSLSLSGNGSIVAVGAPSSFSKGGNETQVETGNRTVAGVVRVYSQEAPPWRQVGQDVDGKYSGERFGWVVSLSKDGGIMAVGAPKNHHGYVRMYQYNNTAAEWQQLGQELSGKNKFSGFGLSVSLSGSGDKAAVNSWTNDGRNYVQVYHYSQESSTWKQMGQDITGRILGKGQNLTGEFSVSLSSAGNELAVCDPLSNAAGDFSGHVQIYQFDSITSSWQPMGLPFIGRKGDELGSSIALNGDASVAAVRASRGGNDQSYVRVFQVDSTRSNWILIGEFFGETADDAFGLSMSLSDLGDILSIGAPRNNANGNDSGRVYVYRYTSLNSYWEQLGDEIDGGGADYVFGSSLSLSHEGYVLAVGAPGNGAGHVQVYRYNPHRSNWTKVSTEILGEAENDSFGRWVSLSGNGDTVAIGGPFNDGNEVDTGHVRVFSWK